MLVLGCYTITDSGLLAQKEIPHMNETKIYPSFKPLIPLYLFGGLLFVAVVAYLIRENSNNWWLLALPVLVDLYAVLQHLMLRSTSLTIEGDLLKYQSGIASKVQRTVVIQKLQDVRVDQSVWQRMLGVGSITLETAGESSRLTMDAIDNPGAIAEVLHQKMQKRV